MKASVEKEVNKTGKMNQIMKINNLIEGFFYKYSKMYRLTQLNNELPQNWR